jgi:hypothetical protein
MSDPTPSTASPSTAAPTAAGDGSVTLVPRPWVGLGTVVLAAAPALAAPRWGGFLWMAAAIALLGAFLLLQTALLRLRFAPDALLVLRGDRTIRRFPYADWLGWRLFLPAVPVLFYFRERQSIHLLPVLFDATALRDQLERRLQPPQPPSP